MGDQVGGDAGSRVEATAQFFQALADPIRLTIVGLLTGQDRRAGELAALLNLPQNALSYHLKQLRQIGILRDRRSSADGRDIYYSLDQEQLAQLYRDAGVVLQPTAQITAPTTPVRILYLCTHNSARSQFAEGLTRHYGGARVDVASAGDHPTYLHPLTRELLTEWGIDPAGLTSKALDQFVGQEFDYVITVCDRVREHCPTFGGEPQFLHWSIPDPTLTPAAERWEAFRAVRQEIASRVRQLLAAPASTLATA